MLLLLVLLLLLLLSRVDRPTALVAKPCMVVVVVVVVVRCDRTINLCRDTGLHTCMQHRVTCVDAAVQQCACVCAPAPAERRCKIILASPAQRRPTEQQHELAKHARACNPRKSQQHTPRVCVHAALVRTRSLCCCCLLFVVCCCCCLLLLNVCCCCCCCCCLPLLFFR